MISVLDFAKKHFPFQYGVTSRSIGHLSHVEFMQVVKTKPSPRFIEFYFECLPKMDSKISFFEDFSFHAHPPMDHNKYETFEMLIKKGCRRIIIHPDHLSLQDIERLRDFQDFLCIENLDFRHPQWRTAKDMEKITEKMPKSRICLDIAHCIDNLQIAEEFIDKHIDKISQVHLGQICEKTGTHLPEIEPDFGMECMRILSALPKDIPVIIEPNLNISILN